MGEAAYRDPPRLELIDGKTVMMSPCPRINHNRVTRNLTRIFDNYLLDKPCEAFGDNTDVYLDEKNHFIPDAMIVCNKDIIHQDGIHGAPDLVVEVLSPSTSKYDRGKKMRAYARAGVKEYWIISPLARSVEVYYLRDGMLVFDDTYEDLPAWELERMEPKERANVHEDIKISLYDDFIVHVRDVFHKIDY